MTSHFIEDMILKQWEQAGGIHAQAAKLVKAEMEQEQEGKTSNPDLKRVQKSQEIQVMKRNQWIYEAVNLKNGNNHIITVQNNLMMCDCKDSIHRGGNCKHIFAVARHMAAEHLQKHIVGGF